jgi:hypothetical protein
MIFNEKQGGVNKKCIKKEKINIKTGGIFEKCLFLHNKIKKNGRTKI